VEEGNVEGKEGDGWIMDCGWLAYDGARTPRGMAWVGGDSAAKYSSPTRVGIGGPNHNTVIRIIITTWD
jgi:hypothetical protein